MDVVGFYLVLATVCYATGRQDPQCRGDRRDSLRLFHSSNYNHILCSLMVRSTIVFLTIS